MKADAQDRLALSCVVEPGDPRLVDLLSVAEPGAVLELVRKRKTDFSDEHVWRAHKVVDLCGQAIRAAHRANLRWLTPADSDWPQQLADLDHVEAINGATGAPLGLWVRGADTLELNPCVSIVGAREATAYGRDAAHYFAAELSSLGYVIVSGAAFGIDAAAHRGALSATGQTVAVLAGGADVTYPRAHESLLEYIRTSGLVISEQVPGATPLKNRFLSRNRIIAALGMGTIVVEAALRSGSLNTLHWADQLSRATMGLPGPYEFRSSAGVHEAIRNGKAVLITKVEHVLDALGAPH